MNIAEVFYLTFKLYLSYNQILKETPVLKTINKTKENIFIFINKMLYHCIYVFQVIAPWIKHFYIDFDGNKDTNESYILPG